MVDQAQASLIDLAQIKKWNPNAYQNMNPFSKVNKFATDYEGFGGSKIWSGLTPGAKARRGRLQDKLKGLEKRQGHYLDTHQQANTQGNAFGQGGVIGPGNPALRMPFRDIGPQTFGGLGPNGNGMNGNAANAGTGQPFGSPYDSKIAAIKHRLHNLAFQKQLNQRQALNPEDLQALNSGRGIYQNALDYLTKASNPEEFLMQGYADRANNPVYNMLEALRQEEATRMQSQLAHRIGAQQGFGSSVLGANEGHLQDIQSRQALENFLTGQNEMVNLAQQAHATGQSTINDILNRQLALGGQNFNLAQLGLQGKGALMGGLNANADRLSNAATANAQMQTQVAIANAQAAAQAAQAHSAGLGGLIQGGLGLLGSFFNPAGAMGGVMGGGTSGIGPIANGSMYGAALSGGFGNYGGTRGIGPISNGAMYGASLAGVGAY